MKEHIKDTIISSISFYVGVIILMIFAYILLGPLLTNIFTKPVNNIDKENVVYDKRNEI